MLSLPQYMIDVGDRAPNVRLPDQAGATVDVYGRVRGGGTVLFLYPGDGEAKAEAALADLARQAGKFAKAGVDLFVVSHQGVAENAALANRHGIEFPVLADQPGELTEAFLEPRRAAAEITEDRRGGADRGPMMSVVLDSNQRVLAVIDVADGKGHARRVLKAVRSLPLPAMPGARAPVLLIPNILDAAYCRELIELWESSNEEGTISTTGPDGRMLNVTDPNRHCRDHIIRDGALNQKIVNIVGRRLVPEVRKAFHFLVKYYEEFYIVGYDAERGDYFGPHRDNWTPANAHRRFAISLNLNTGEYEGGGVRFPEYSPDVYDPEAGGAVIFSCSLLHEAVPVTSGRRFILSGFMWGEQEQQARQRMTDQAAAGQMQRPY